LRGQATGKAALVLSIWATKIRGGPFNVIKRSGRQNLNRPIQIQKAPSCLALSNINIGHSLFTGNSFFLAQPSLALSAFPISVSRDFSGFRGLDFLEQFMIAGASKLGSFLDIIGHFCFRIGVTE